MIDNIYLRYSGRNRRPSVHYNTIYLLMDMAYVKKKSFHSFIFYIVLKHIEMPELPK